MLCSITHLYDYLETERQKKSRKKKRFLRVIPLYCETESLRVPSLPMIRLRCTSGRRVSGKPLVMDHHESHRNVRTLCTDRKIAAHRLYFCIFFFFFYVFFSTSKLTQVRQHVYYNTSDTERSVFNEIRHYSRKRE